MGNQDAAQQCYDRARSAVGAGDFDRALRLVEKGMRFDPASAAEGAALQGKIAQLKKRASAPQSDSSSASPSSGGGSTPSPAASRRTAPSASSTPSAASYTPEMMASVRRIKAARNDYYKILGVEKNATDSEIKKAYRKIAVKLHPDKNNAPGAEDAFKSVGGAYQCLSDAQKRAGYDRYGTEDPHSGGGGGGRGGMRYQRQDVDPEDIFNMFFGMQPGVNRRRAGGQSRQQQARQQGEGGETNHNLGSLMQLMPLLLLFLFSFLGNSATNTTPFRLERAGDFMYKRQTVQTNVPYFVKASFEQEYARFRPNLLRVEKEVDRQHLNNLVQSCRQEQHNKRRAIQEARFSLVSSKERKRLERRARALNTPSCSSLKQQGYEVRGGF